MNIHDSRFDSDNPSTWGYTPKARRIGGLTVRGGRLYYAVADGPQIWSIGINGDGSFGTDARREIDGSAWPSKNAVADMAFDREGTLYLAQRGDQRGGFDHEVFAEPGKSAVLRYPLRAGTSTTVSFNTATPQQYAVGTVAPSQNASGGVALGYGFDNEGHPQYSACDRTVWSTGDAFGNKEPTGQSVVHGLQGNDRDLVLPQQAPANAYFAEYDPNFEDADSAGHIGAVKIWAPCEQFAGVPGAGSITPPPGGGVPLSLATARSGQRRGCFTPVSSTGQCNTACSLSAGVWKPKVFRGR